MRFKIFIIKASFVINVLLGSVFAFETMQTMKELNSRPKIQTFAIKKVFAEDIILTVESPTINVKNFDIVDLLCLNRPLTKTIRKEKQKQVISYPKKALIFDDGSIDSEKINEAFNKHFSETKDNKKKLSLQHKNLFNCTFGKHATAVASSLVQAYARAPICVVGGGSENYSDSPYLETQYANNLIDEIKKGALGDFCILSASYGTSDYKGSLRMILDEGGLWKEFWKSNKNSVVVQACGNENCNLSGLIYETAFNMKYAMDSNLTNRYVQIMGFNESKNDIAYFSNYYKIQSYKNKSTTYAIDSYARDHSIMAPSSKIAIPVDTFDDDNDKVIFEQYNESKTKEENLSYWNGTSGATPIFAGAVLRLVNDFSVTAEDATKLLLDYADVKYISKVGGNVKILNLGRGLEESLKRQIYNDISQLKNSDERCTYFVNFYNKYYNSISDYDLSCKNFVLDIAKRLEILRVINSNGLTNDELAGLKLLFSNTYLIENKETAKNNKYIVLSIVPNTDQSILGCSFIKVLGRTATFGVYLNKLESALDKTNKFQIKGILDASLKKTFNSKDKKYWEFTYEVPSYFSSKRKLVIDTDSYQVFGINDNCVEFNKIEFSKINKTTIDISHVVSLEKLRSEIVKKETENDNQENKVMGKIFGTFESAIDQEMIIKIGENERREDITSGQQKIVLDDEVWSGKKISIEFNKKA